MIHLNELIKNLPEGTQLIHQGPQQTLHKVSTPELADPHSVVFVSSIDLWNKALENESPLIFVHMALKEKINPIPHDRTIVLCSSVQLTMAHVLNHFDPKHSLYKNEIHPTAIVAKTASIGAHVKIGAYSIIDDHAILEDHVTIGAHCHIENSAKIGKNSLLHSHVVIAYKCVIGTDCEIHSHTVIGSDGYGYATDKNNHHHKIPQLGNVVIGNHVEIGAQTAIDRATLTSTTVGDYTKIDNLCHIAHNCEIGRGCFITAGFACAGSTQIGDFFMCGGTTAIGDHVKITHNVQLAGASVVLADITKPGSYGGNPLEPMNDYLKTKSSLLKLTNLRKQLQKIMKFLNISDTDINA